MLKLVVDYLPEIDNEWAGALGRNKDSIKGFYPSVLLNSLRP